MKVFDIKTPQTIGQKHMVVADTMAKAEEIYLKEYGPTTILEIILLSEYVLIQGDEDGET